MSLLATSLLTYRNATDFYMLTLYPVTWLNSLSVLVVFWWSPYCCLYIVSCHLQIEVLLLLFQFGYLFFLFVVWLLCLGLTVLCWIKVVRVDILDLFLILEEKLFLTIEYGVFHIWPLWCWPMFPLNLCWVFIINGCCTLSTFSASIEMIIWFLSFLLLMWCITLIDLQVLNHPFIPGIKTTCSWWMIFFIIVELDLLIFCWGFLHLCSSETLAYSLLSLVVSLFGFGIRVMLDL